MKRIIQNRQAQVAPHPAEVAVQTHVSTQPNAEQLVGLGFRYWLTGFRTGDLRCWERAWSAYAGLMGANGAKSAITDLSCWVRAISRHARRPLETADVDCDRFCRDECIAIAMIAACQHNACPAMRACAFSLLGCAMMDEVVEGAEAFANTMRGAEQVLRPSFAPVATLGALPSATAALQ